MIQTGETYHLLKRSLEGTVKRQDAIASNIANAATRGYQANRVDFETGLREAMERSRGESPERRAEAIRNSRILEEKDTSTAMNNDGNNVDLDQEMSNLAANQIFHQTLIQQINTRFQMLRSVIFDGRG